jgi:hypothetical protein
VEGLFFVPEFLRAEKGNISPRQAFMDGEPSFWEATMAGKKKKENSPLQGQEQDQHAKIAQTAYFIAESRGFQPGQELDDWVKAESIVYSEQDHS